ncbi:hypothetical protein P171DRAFT_470977 [Karstenula rhodostoma CBS 690.94]|uniref:Uncharacterized protein n=1 Tax=Karstenula rhodostoma CBS 690.94 TaxID=1392251 RepID=A0A9P4UET6_9PLEO|nr:hypothetical protein P171DRAFT_470977 [Karstenula rhodostoma CBS 690.94]
MQERSAYGSTNCGACLPYRCHLGFTTQRGTYAHHLKSRLRDKMDHLDDIEKLSNRIARHAHVIYGSTYPSAHTFEVVTTCYPREASGDAGAKLVAFLGDNFKNCLMLKQSGARPSDKGAIEALWSEIQSCMLDLRPFATGDGRTWLRPRVVP